MAVWNSDGSRRLVNGDSAARRKHHNVCSSRADEIRRELDSGATRPCTHTQTGTYTVKEVGFTSRQIRRETQWPQTDVAEGRLQHCIIYLGRAIP